jgi:hypothetical protein
MTRKELDKEIRETTQTLNHLRHIGEDETAIRVANYLDELLDKRRNLPDLKLVKR